MAEENNVMDNVVVDKVSDRIDSIVVKLDGLVKDFVSNYKIITKELRDTRKDAIKLEKKGNKKVKKVFTGERKPSGITCPVTISGDLHEFLKTEIFNNDEFKNGLDEVQSAKLKPVFEGDIGSSVNGEGEFKIARTMVNKLITTYIQYHGLKDKTDGRVIVLEGDKGEILKNILSPKPEPDDIINFFNVQRYLKGHYPKGAKAIKKEAEEAEEAAEEAKVEAAETKAKVEVKEAKSTPNDKDRGARRVRRVRKEVAA